MNFEFAAPARIIFGPGRLAELPVAVRGFGHRALVVTGRHPGRAATLISSLQGAGISTSTLAISSEPSVEIVREGAALARVCDFVVGFGGGSALDAAKAIAAVAPNSGEPLDYLEVVGRGQPLKHTPLPFVAIPTTAGTGAEVTRNAVLESREHGVKASLRSPSMLARVALVDPELTISLPPPVTARTGLDTLTQLIEAYVSCRANAMTDLLCIEGVEKAFGSLRVVFADGSDLGAREAMSWASLLSGLALSNAGLGAVHGFAAPLGGYLHAPHGALCAAILPHAMLVNMAALRERASDRQPLDRYRRIAVTLTGNPNAKPEDGSEAVASLCRELGVPRLSEYGLIARDIPSLVEKAAQASSMKGNPIALTRSELASILERAI